MPSVAWADTITPTKPTTGDGSANNPYQIRNKEELYWFAGLVNGDASVCNDVVNQNTAACAKLMNDIVVNYDDDFSNHNWNSISRSNWFFWTPIGKQDFNIYTGTFDGQGHTISGLYFESCSNYYDQKSKEYDYQNRDYLSFGLFGFNSGTIKNVGVINSYFGWQYNLIGGICGENSGTIENCYNAGKVEGKGFYTGGICARNLGTITNCYNLGTVIGEYGTGGVCVDNFETIKNCYYLSGTAAGGIAGADDTPGSVEVKDATQFASGEVAWLLNGERSEGAEENPLAWYQNIGVDSYPVLDSSHKTVYCGYKDCTLSYSNNQAELRESPVHHYDNGICKACKAYQPATLTTDTYDINGDNTNDNVYEIGNAGQLYWFAGLVNGTLVGVTRNKSANAVLTNNITVNEGVLDTNGEPKSASFRKWTPIGVFEKATQTGYNGTFDGNNKTISGLYFNDTTIGRIGLFGAFTGTVKNVGVVDSYFNGLTLVGGVCGYAKNGIITNSYNNSTVIGGDKVGGICGENDINGKIINCYNLGAVSGTTNVGGMCGLNSNGTITNCYYLANEDDKNGGKEETQFKSGEVAYLLAQGCKVGETFYDGSVWGQQLGENDYPVLGSAYKVLMAARDGLEGSIYWATFSNLNSNAELIDPKGDITVYNATVSSGTLTLAKRSDNNVSSGEGVLLKAYSEYVNAKNISDEVSAATIGENDLLATPKDAGVINAGTGYTLYRLTYNDVESKEGLGFYLGVVGESKDGSQLKATPGKAYLKVATDAATDPSTSKLARGFAFPDNDDETVTGISGVTVSDRIQTSDRIYDLQGRPVVNPTKGVYIRNGRKVVY